VNVSYLTDAEDLKQIPSWDDLTIGETVFVDAGVLNYYYKDAYFEAKVEIVGLDPKDLHCKVAIDDVHFVYVGRLSMIRRCK
jgi:hypothetical protein